MLGQCSEKNVQTKTVTMTKLERAFTDYFHGQIRLPRRHVKARRKGCLRIWRCHITFNFGRAPDGREFVTFCHRHAICGSYVGKIYEDGEVVRMSFTELKQRLDMIASSTIKADTHVSQLAPGGPVFLHAHLCADGPEVLRDSWVPGIRHVAVVFGVDEEDHPVVGDPSFGLERWGMTDLGVLFTGLAIVPMRRASRE